MLAAPVLTPAVTRDQPLALGIPLPATASRPRSPSNRRPPLSCPGSPHCRPLSVGVFSSPNVLSLSLRVPRCRTSATPPPPPVLTPAVTRDPYAVTSPAAISLFPRSPATLPSRHPLPHPRSPATSPRYHHFPPSHRHLSRGHPRPFPAATCSHARGHPRPALVIIVSLLPAATDSHARGHP